MIAQFRRVPTLQVGDADASSTHLNSGGAIILHASLIVRIESMEFSSQARDTALKVLQVISENPDLIDKDERFKSLIAKIYKQGKKHNKTSKSKEAQDKSTDQQNCCFICQQNFFQAHHFYEGICISCGELNYEKRQQKVNLNHQIALVTGARLRIGYATVLKLLRSGATVIATTRFPHDAAKRYAEEKDFQEWKYSLHIYGLDLRHLESLERFIEHLLSFYSRLDIIINNAAQTVRRPSHYYRHLLDFESLSWQALPESIKTLVSDHHDFYLGSSEQKFNVLSSVINTQNNQAKISSQLITRANFPALLSQINLLSEDRENNASLFPQGKYNQDGEQLDLRIFNSWLMKDEDVDPLELLEVHLINAIAPFIINSRLKALMKSQPDSDKFIINVSSAEGNFNNSHKSWRHPHTNMAKAALNQMTKTCAKEYAQHRIFMNAVDPGWVSFQHPNHKVKTMEEKGTKLYLTPTDSAARIYDLIYLGVAKKQYFVGKLFKNYQEISW